MHMLGMGYMWGLILGVMLNDLVVVSLIACVGIV
jgi:hypothetical protein